MKWVIAAALLLAACDGDGGTIALTLATAPGSELLSSVDMLRVTTSNPRTVNEAKRDSDGIDLSIELDAGETAGVIYIEGFDSAGALIATGQSAPFTLGGGDAHVAIYVAEPFSINEAPVKLATGRADLAASPIVFGAVIAGGVDGAGGLSDALTIYNVYSHSLQEGAAMPSRRRGQSIGANTGAGVYLFGGAGENGTPTSSLYELITTTPPQGSYITVGDQAGFERTDQSMLQFGPDSFVITGSPAIGVGLGAFAARDDLPALDRRGASFPGAQLGMTGRAAALTADGSSLVAFDRTSFTQVPLPHSGSVAALPDGSFVVIGLSDALHVTGDTMTMSSPLSVSRIDPAVAATAHYVVVAGGLDGAQQPIPSADILDARTLELVTTVPILPRVHTQAVVMQNEQVMLVGGDVASDVIELFTPPVATN